MVNRATILVISLTLISIKAATATESGCWVTDAHGAKVIRVTPAGVEKFTVTGFDYPVSAVIDVRTDDVWVGDTGTGKLTKLKKNGSILKRVYVGTPRPAGNGPSGRRGLGLEPLLKRNRKGQRERQHIISRTGHK